ncbi:hypothetical protein PR017_21595 (plasmid) [Rhizobium tumorigenes]|uniref:Uncharacterized protein n=1 Tax=Rhizobium tumorigenes TaxID=2041385 RepID=A0AAF1KMZ1_9HYPH|nr:hypothetical protein [Rhizobium tumorigenes]WFR98163.1 hypothetical protein PR017_21595 [Rhizobium tumorigenes]
MRQAAVGKQAMEGIQDTLFACRFEGFADKKEARTLVCDSQWVTVSVVAELELALEVGAPQFIGQQGLGQVRSFGLVAVSPAGMGDKAMPVENGVNGACGRAHAHRRKAS